jgi:LemA protein
VEIERSVHFDVNGINEAPLNQNSKPESIMSWLLILIPVVVLLAALGYGAGIYNRLVTFKNRFANSFSQIEVQLKRRYDLIPNLVETAKAYMSHERQTLEAVVAARTRAVSGLQQAAANPGSPAAMQALSGAEQGLSGALGRLFAVAESYPDLKANQNMMQLSEEITSTENKVSFARQAYNDAVTQYNTYKHLFPPVIVAGLLGFGSDAELLHFDQQAIADAPKVTFS